MTISKEYIYAFVGILIGALISGLVMYFIFLNNKPTFEKTTITSTDVSTESGTHVMPDGTVMSNMDDEMSMDDMTSVLEGKSGDEFDKEFIKQMIVHHEGAVDMAELALKSAKHQEIIDLSSEIIRTQSSEIQMMKDWNASWGY
jgi:uncharacterized protein (DUF305 family)